MKERYKPMIDSDYSTLWEIFKEGNWSHNHAWSGGPLSLMYKYIAGIEPEKPGFNEFHVFPNPTGYNQIDCHFSTIKGEIALKYTKENALIYYQIKVPKQTSAIIRIPKNNTDYKIKGRGNYKEVKEREDRQYRYFKLASGQWKIESGID
jgi:hypothetical protein